MFRNIPDIRAATKRSDEKRSTLGPGQLLKVTSHLIDLIFEESGSDFVVVKHLEWNRFELARATDDSNRVHSINLST